MLKTNLHIPILLLFWPIFLSVSEQQADSTTAKLKLRYDESAINPVEISQNDLKAYKNDKTFDYTEAIPQDNWWTRFNTWLNDLYSSFIQWILGGKEAQGILKFFLQALPYLIIGGVLAFIIWLFIRIDMGGSLLLGSSPNKVILNSEEQLIQHEDLQALVEEAVKDNNYRLAIRYYYLLVLQNLSKKQLIEWQAQKTNHDYVYEIQDTALRGQFSKLTRIYDFIWYGNFEVNESAFAKAQQEFLNVNKGI
jgi:hypothetical protein